MVVDAGAIAQLAQLISSPDARLKVGHSNSCCTQRVHTCIYSISLKFEKLDCDNWSYKILKVFYLNRVRVNLVKLIHLPGMVLKQTLIFTAHVIRHACYSTDNVLHRAGMNADFLHSNIRPSK